MYPTTRRGEKALQAPDAPGAVAARIAYRKAAERAVREREERYPVLTAENAAEAIRWQAERIRALLA